MKNDDNLFEKLNKKFDELFGALDSDDGDLDHVADLEDLDDLDNIVTLNDENGEEVQFVFLDLIEYMGEEYVILLPKDESDDAEEVVILKVDESDSEDEEMYTSVDDEEVLQAVFNIFKEKFKDEFNFTE